MGCKTTTYGVHNKNRPHSTVMVVNSNFEKLDRNIAELYSHVII